MKANPALLGWARLAGKDFSLVVDIAQVGVSACTAAFPVEFRLVSFFGLRTEGREEPRSFFYVGDVGWVRLFCSPVPRVRNCDWDPIH